MSGKTILVGVSGNPNIYKDADFLIDGKLYREPFLIKAYAETLEGERETVIFLPHSLWVEEELKELLEAFGLDKVLISPSIGKFKGYNYSATYDYIVLWFFLNILDSYLNAKSESLEIYCDIALGWSVYSDALKEALKQLLVFDKLMHFQEPRLRGFRIFSDPIIGNQQEAYRGYTQEIKVKVWFDSPLGVFNKEFLRGLYLNDKEIDLLKRFNYVYRAVKYNAPLVLFTFGYDSADAIMNTIRDLLERFKIEFDPLKHTKGATIEYPMPSNPRDLVSLFQTLALYYNLAKVLEKAGIPKEGTEEVSLDQLHESAMRIFESYGLYTNCIFLNKEIKGLKDRLKKQSVGPHYESLGFYLDRANFKPKNSIYLRNFLAHAGLEMNYTEIKRQGNDLIVRYSPKRKENLKNLLQNKATCR